MHQKRESRSMVATIPSNLSAERNRSDSSNAVHYAARGSRNFMENRWRNPVTNIQRPDMERFGETAATFILALRIFRGDVSILCQCLCAVVFTTDGRWIERERKVEREWSWNSRRETRNLSEARKACKACSSFDVTVLHSIPLKKTKRFRFFGQI